MRSFTAKEFSRCPAQVYEAAREDGKVEITHDRFYGVFQLYHNNHPDHMVNECEIIEIAGQKLRVVPWKQKAPD